MRTLIVLSTLLAVAFCEPTVKRYDGDKVLRIVPETAEQLKFLTQFMHAPSTDYEFWREPTATGETVDLHISAKWVQEIIELLKAAGIPYTVTVEDVQRLIEHVNQQSANHTREVRGIVGTFPSLADTQAWMTQLCGTYSTMTSCGTVGKSYEGRSINYIKIGTKSATIKKVIFIEGGMHAREWLSPATVISITDYLLRAYNQDPNAKRLLDTYDFLVVPIANVDGYEYSRTYERLWRKTRSRTSVSSCYGADPNRNWDYMFGIAGVSTSPCTDTYPGPKAFSEVETAQLANFILANKQNMLAYFSFHSYSQFWLMPYGYGPAPADYNELLRVAQTGGRALMSVNNKQWQIGSIQNVIYEASGGSIDWVYGTAGIKYSYCLELRPTQASMNGFVVPTSEIDPSFREVWAGLVTAIDAMQK